MKKKDSYTLADFQGLVWMVVFCMLFFYVLQTDPFAEAFNYASNTILSYATIIYGNALLLMPYLYSRRKYMLYAVSVVFLLLVISYLRVEVQGYILDHYISQVHHKLLLKDYLYTFISLTLVYIFSIAFRFTLDFFGMRAAQEKLLKENAEAQLNLLKAQVHPHFLFNTLNNIYFVAQRESPHTADLLEKLSSIMRYFIYQGANAKIRFDEEMDFIRNYIDLEKMRMRFPVRVSIEVTGKSDAVFLPPMLLIPLVENVFKHGLDKSGKESYLGILVEIQDRLVIKVINSLGPNQEAANAGKLGLRNLDERLKILYADKYELTNLKKNNEYTSTLNIPIW